MNDAVATDDLKLGLLEMEFSDLYLGKVASTLLGWENISIENELERITQTWKKKCDVIWSVSGNLVDYTLALRVIAALEIRIASAIQHANASVVSIDIKRESNIVVISITDNGQVHDEEIELHIEILQELSGGA